METITLNQAVYLTKLFLPQLIEYDGGIFLEDHFEKSDFEIWKTHLNGDITAIEKVINHVHIEDLVLYPEDLDFKQLLYLGQSVAFMWEHYLKTIYPNCKFKVTCDSEFSSVVVTFYQIKNP